MTNHTSFGLDNFINDALTQEAAEITGGGRYHINNAIDDYTGERWSRDYLRSTWKDWRKRFRGNFATKRDLKVAFLKEFSGLEGQYEVHEEDRDRGTWLPQS